MRGSTVAVPSIGVEWYDTFSIARPVGGMVPDSKVPVHIQGADAAGADAPVPAVLVDMILPLREAVSKEGLR